MEEMIINDNVLSELPTSIGLLRNLNTLIADHNLLSELPHSICSCVSLRILSLADNNIRQLPEDLGRLTSLKVMNFSNNILTHLPFSLTQIEYKSLWLSDNQNRPILQLNSELHSPYQKVLTCVLLPQVTCFFSASVYSLIFIYQTKEEPVMPDSLEPQPVNRRKSSFLISSIDKPLINFNLNCEGDNQSTDTETAKLLRQPTPYPKDLKVHARHARNLVLKHLDFGNTISLDNAADKTDELSSKIY